MTNQASEYNIREFLRNRISNISTAAEDDILDLIRTEKLKLLAEVGERVVGELSELDSNGRYNLKVEQRTALTKLEAEL